MMTAQTTKYAPIAALSRTLAQVTAERDRLRAALGQAAAALAVVANHAGETHPGCADVSNLYSIRGFAHEAFCIARAALAQSDKGE